MVFEHREYADHEQVLFCRDESVGLFGIIAIHSTALGPAAGGCRMQPYASTDEALTDVLRLSEGMSLKNAIAGLPLGGGKCVISADPNSANKASLLRAFSYHVQSLNGRFWTAIDVGVGPADADVLAENCDFIFANASRYKDGFNPSEYTALGGFVSLKAATMHVWGTQDLAGRRIAIQGLGATGASMAKRLYEAGAELVVADVRSESVEPIVDQFGARSVDPDEIHSQDVDIFVPCALGAIINDDTLPDITARVICGLANNQLAEPRHGAELQAAGITYVPDYVANGGGIAAAGSMIYSSPTADDMAERVHRLYETVSNILTIAAEQKRSSSEVADELAHERISEATATKR